MVLACIGLCAPYDLSFELACFHRRQCSPGAPPGARFAAVTFLQRFGAALNPHLDFHCCVIDGLFSAAAQGLRSHEATALTETDVAAVQTLVRQRVIALFKRRGLLTPEAAASMRQWDHGGGFSLDATIRIEAADRPGLERLLRMLAAVHGQTWNASQMGQSRPERCLLGSGAGSS